MQLTHCCGLNSRRLCRDPGDLVHVPDVVEEPALNSHLRQPASVTETFRCTAPCMRVDGEITTAYTPNVPYFLRILAWLFPLRVLRREHNFGNTSHMLRL